MPKLITTKVELTLDCYPKPASSRSHGVPNSKSASSIQQPWDAADIYLIEEANLGKQPAILNDQWGALTCFLESLGQSYYSWSDSFCSQQATRNNLAALKNNSCNNQLSTGIPAFPPATDSIWVQCPKSFDQLQWWLTLAIKQLGPGIPVYVAGMAKHIPIKWLNWLENHNKDYQQYPIKKKARLLQFNLPDKLPPLKEEKGYVGPDNLAITALPGVFSRDHMDIGSRFFIHQLASLPALTGKVVDLGCGNGLLSIAALHYSQADNIDLVLCDDSCLALEAANRNLKLRQYDKAEYRHTDALLGVDAPIDTVLCNPPFHSGNKISTAAAERMFKQAAKVLAPNGQLLVIANRHLGYAASLKKSFNHVKLIASDAKFVTYRCTSPKHSSVKHV